MSAFIVSNEHINALITFALENRVSYWNPGTEARVDVTAFNAEEVGRILMDENARSVGYRYGGRIEMGEKDAGAAYRFRRFPCPLTAVEVIKAVHCLNYQSCETPDWDSTVAWRILQGIKNAAEHKLPGYDQAPWGIDDRSGKGLKYGSLRRIA